MADDPSRDTIHDGHIETESLVDLAEHLARQAGALLLDGLTRTRSHVSTKSSGTDMVTEMDRASEAAIVRGIRAERPRDSILGEEGTEVEGTSGIRWVIDPLDGTTNYLYGHPGFGVSVAVEEHGSTLAGIVFEPIGGDLFRATLGGGATRNGHPIHTSDRTTLQDALVATGFSYDATERVRQASVLTSLLGDVRDIRRMGAASVDLCSVACARVDAFFERGLKPWDFAAGILIASEAGAFTGDLSGGPAGSGMCFAAAPGLADPLGRLLIGSGAVEGVSTQSVSR